MKGSFTVGVILVIYVFYSLGFWNRCKRNRIDIRIEYFRILELYKYKGVLCLSSAVIYQLAKVI